MVLAVGTCRIGAALWTGLGSPDFILEATRMAGIFSFCFPNTFLSAAAVTAETAGREGEKDTLGKLLYTKAACFAAGISQTSLEFKSSNKTFQENKQKSKKKEGGGGKHSSLKSLSALCQPSTCFLQFYFQFFTTVLLAISAVI